MWAAIEKQQNRFVGQVGLVAQEIGGETELEVGYLLLRSCWGNGYATEAARACCDYGFRELGAERLISLIDPRNEPSQRVAERLGMRFEREIEKWDKRVRLYSVSQEMRT